MAMSKDLIRISTKKEYPRPHVAFYTSDGREIHGLRSATISLDAGKLAVAVAEVKAYVAVSEMQAIFGLRMIDPATGAMKLVRRIEYLDSTVFDVEEFVRSRDAVAGAEFGDDRADGAPPRLGVTELPDDEVPA